MELKGKNMRMLVRFLNLHGEASSKKNAFWNMVASFLYAGQTFVFLLMVTRVIGADSGGIFSIAFAVATLLETVARYGMSEFQATDVHGQYKLNHYFWLRIFTSIAMVGTCFFYVCFAKYSSEKALTVTFLVVVKVADSVDNVFNTMFQQQGRLECGSKITTIRVALSYFCFAMAVFVTGDLVKSCGILAVTSLFILFGCIRFIVPVLKKETWGLEIEVLGVAKECFPLFLGSFVLVYIYNLPKYAIDHYLAEGAQGYFAVLFLPVSAINLLSGFVFRPILTDISFAWQGEDYRGFVRFITKQCIWILLTTSVLLVAGEFAGLSILSFFYGMNLMGYRLEFMLLLVAGGLNALIRFLALIITTMRYPRKLLFFYALGAILGTVLSGVLLPKYGVLGAAILYAVTLFALLLCLGIFVYGTIKKRRNK